MKGLRSRCCLWRRLRRFARQGIPTHECLGGRRFAGDSPADNLGIAMDSDEGLLVPVVKAAEGMSVVGLAREMERLRRKVQEKKISVDDLSGGSFTLSNPGREGNLFGFAIINQPQVGILRMGEVKKRPVVIEVDGVDALAIRTMMYLALSV